MAAAVAHSFNKLLSQPTKAISKSRATGEIEDGTKKLRRMILVEGIPSSIVRSEHFQQLAMIYPIGIGPNLAPTDMENSASSE